MKKIAVVALIALSSIGCKKDSSIVNEDPSPTGGTSGKFLKKVNYWMVAENKEVTIKEIVMSASGDITALKTYNTSGKVLTEYTSIKKDASGRVTEISGEEKYSATPVPVTWTFTYTGAGNLSQALLSKNGSAFSSTYREYDANNRMVLERDYDQVAKKVITEYTYTYTGSSQNPTSKTYGSTTITYKFDAKKNPYLLAPAFIYVIGMGDFYKSNVIESTSGGTVTKSTLTYNADGYALSTTNGSGSGLKFVYGD